MLRRESSRQSGPRFRSRRAPRGTGSVDRGRCALCVRSQIALAKSWQIVLASDRLLFHDTVTRPRCEMESCASGSLRRSPPRADVPGGGSTARNRHQSGVDKMMRSCRRRVFLPRGRQSQADSPLPAPLHAGRYRPPLHPVRGRRMDESKVRGGSGVGVACLTVLLAATSYAQQAPAGLPSPASQTPATQTPATQQPGALRSPPTRNRRHGGKYGFTTIATGTSTSAPEPACPVARPKLCKVMGLSGHGRGGTQCQQISWAACRFFLGNLRLTNAALEQAQAPSASNNPLRAHPGSHHQHPGDKEIQRICSGRS